MESRDVIVGHRRLKQLVRVGQFHGFHVENLDLSLAVRAHRKNCIHLKGTSNNSSLLEFVSSSNSLNESPSTIVNPYNRFGVL